MQGGDSNPAICKQALLPEPRHLCDHPASIPMVGTTIPVTNPRQLPLKRAKRIKQLTIVNGFHKIIAESEVNSHVHGRSVEKILEQSKAN